MIFGTIVDNFGFVVGDKADIAKAEQLRRERCTNARAAHAAGDPAAPEEYRKISMLHEERGKFWTYFKLEYGKNKQGSDDRSHGGCSGLVGSKVPKPQAHLFL